MDLFEQFKQILHKNGIDVLPDMTAQSGQVMVDGELYSVNAQFKIFPKVDFDKVVQEILSEENITAVAPYKLHDAVNDGHCIVEAFFKYG